MAPSYRPCRAHAGRHLTITILRSGVNHRKTPNVLDQRVMCTLDQRPGDTHGVDPLDVKSFRRIATGGPSAGAVARGTEEVAAGSRDAGGAGSYSREAERRASLVSSGDQPPLVDQVNRQRSSKNSFGWSATSSSA